MTHIPINQHTDTRLIAISRLQSGDVVQ